MSRQAKGSIYRSGGALYLSLSLDKRRSFRLEACRTEAEAELRRSVVVPAALRLKKAGHIDTSIRFCEQAGFATDETLAGLLKLVEGLLRGEEAIVVAKPDRPGKAPDGLAMTVREFGEKLWTNNELARRYRGRVKEIDHTENKLRLEKHVYPVEFRGTTIGETRMSEFTLDHADHVLAQPTLPEGSLRHVAQCMHRLFKLAVYPARILRSTPFPPGWLPQANPVKEASFLYPDEEAAFLGNVEVPLVKRLFLGFCAREGLRKSDGATLQWSNLSLDQLGGAGHVVLDTSKNGRGGSWALDPGTAEALRRWRKLCPSTVYVFPAEALPGSRAQSKSHPLSVGHIADALRDGLIQAGVTRAKLFEQGKHRLRLRAHDLRATFVTLALAAGRSEDWVRTRTGHSSSQMVARYRRQANTAAELNLGWLKPLHVAIPELAEMGVREDGSSTGTGRSTRLRVIVGGKR